MREGRGRALEGKGNRSENNSYFYTFFIAIVFHRYVYYHSFPFFHPPPPTLPTPARSPPPPLPHPPPPPIPLDKREGGRGCTLSNRSYSKTKEATSSCFVCFLSSTIEIVIMHVPFRCHLSVLVSLSVCFPP